MTQRKAVSILGALAAGMLACAPVAADRGRDDAGSLRVSIRTTSYGIPHILARSYEELGAGVGYAMARNKICDIAEIFVTVNGERSRYFGAGAADANIQSDIFWKRIGQIVDEKRMLKARPPLGPTAELRDLVRGFVAGYNEMLDKVGVDDPVCRSAAWIRPLTERDMYLRAMFRTIGSNTSLIPQYANAAPPSAGPIVVREVPDVPVPTASNTIMFGRDATDNGRGLAFINPHFTFAGTEGKFEAHLTIPGKLNVAGAVHLGTPMVWSGFNQHVAWQHTASTPARFTRYRLKLVPGSDTAYEYDGEVRHMKTRLVSFDVLRPDGTLERRQHRMWESHFGPMVETAAFPWTSTTAYALRDDLLLSFRWLNQDLAINHARSVDDIDAVSRKYMDIGWLNIHATDSGGKVLFADRSAVPNVTDAKAAACGGGDPNLLDGSRSECEWGTDPDSVTPGAFGPSSLPQQIRHDYVHNANNSYWLTNARQPLEGYARIVGPERVELNRARTALLKIERRLAGTDGHPGNRFSPELVKRVFLDSQVLYAELWRDDVVALCRTLPPEAMGNACDVLAAWDKTESVDSRGSILWRRFDQNLAPVPWKVPFNPADPLNTPRGIDTTHPAVAAALTRAVADLRNSGIPLDAGVRGYQYMERNGERFPIPGGNRGSQYNVTSAAWVPGQGFPNVVSGAYYNLIVQFTDKGPVAQSVVLYGQSNNPNSPHFTDQMRLWSEGKLRAMHFTERDIASDPNLVITELRIRRHRDKDRHD